MFVLERWARQLKRSRIRSKGLPAGAELLTTTSRAGCRFGLLTECPLVPNDPAPRHADIHPEPVRDGPIRQPLLAQLVGALVQVDAPLAGHGLVRDQEPHDQRRRGYRPEEKRDRAHDHLRSAVSRPWWVAAPVRRQTARLFASR